LQDKMLKLRIKC